MDERRHALKDCAPLKLTLGRWLTRDEEEADFTFEVYPSIDGAEIGLSWGPGVRQHRAYMAGLDDLRDLHEWLGKVLRLDDA
jgi:hypothetical protein